MITLLCLHRAPCRSLLLLSNFRTQRGNIRIEPEVLHGACHLIVLDVVYGEPDVVCDVMPK